MDDESLRQQILHYRQVEKFSQRQIAKVLNVSRGRVKRVLAETRNLQPISRKLILDEYVRLVAQWYQQHPRLKAVQIHDRLKSYGYTGSYPTVVRLCREYRKPKPSAYHPLIFLPGEEAPVDWFFFNHEKLGQVAGFVYVLSYSRYAWGMFYPKTTFEFFLAGHVACFQHIGGCARTHRYDNLKSVVLKRHPGIEYNPQFLDFARFYGFGIHACNPYSGNEKGRVERLIRDIRVFLYGETFADLAELNKKFHLWLEARNIKEHRSTGKTPKELLGAERLWGLPEHPYPTSRVVAASVSKTALVEFETNRYSVPSTCAGKSVDIAAYPGYIEIYLCEQKVAIHERCFGRRQQVQNPLHVETLLTRTPQFKMQRVLQLVEGMNPVFKDFLDRQDNEIKRAAAAYQMFLLLKTHSKPVLISAVRELCGMGCFKIETLLSLLHLPSTEEPQAVWPKNKTLLTLKYQERNLNDYDPDSTRLGTT